MSHGKNLGESPQGRAVPSAQIALKKSGFAPFVPASATRAGCEGAGGILREFHAANPAAQAVSERAVFRLAAGDFIAEPDEKDPGEKNQEADKNEPREFDGDHGDGSGHTSAPH